MACIDAPELKGSRANPKKAKAARDYLRSLTYKKVIQIHRITKDRYGRTIGELSLNGKNIQKELIAKGYAKIYKKYAGPCPWAQK